MCPEVFVGCGCTSTNILQYILFLRDGDFSCDATRGLDLLENCHRIASGIRVKEVTAYFGTSVDNRNLLPVLKIAEN
jgi:hypothetical protein